MLLPALSISFSSVHNKSIPMLLSKAASRIFRPKIIFIRKLSAACRLFDPFVIKIIHDNRLIASPEIEVFQPDQVTLPLYPPDNRFHIRNAGKDR